MAAQGHGLRAHAVGLDELMARYASYEDLATIIRHRFQAPADTLHELFKRLVFNILCGNTDDHARNHAAFWDGRSLNLTPAYDICPQQRAGNEATQAMLIIGDQRFSRLSVCLKAAPVFCYPWTRARSGDGPDQKNPGAMGSRLRRGRTERGRPAAVLAASVSQPVCLRGRAARNCKAGRVENDALA